MTKAFIFPGQGAQYTGMGKDFHDHFLEAREVFQEADEILSRPLSKLIFTGSEEDLSRTDNSQVAIFVTTLAILKTCQKQLPELKASLFGGLSLGEYSALCASGKIDFKTCLEIVGKRGDLMQQASLNHPSTMLAVLGVDEEKVKALQKGYWIANLNCPGQVVIGLRLQDKEKVELIFKGLGRVIPLKVAGAFHTPLMESAKEGLTSSIMEAIIKKTDTKLTMNVVGDFVFEPEEIKKCLIEQVTSTTRWVDCMNSLKNEKPSCFIEMGPSQLITMNKRMDLGIPSIKIATIEDLEKAHESI